MDIYTSYIHTYKLYACNKNAYAYTYTYIYVCVCCVCAQNTENKIANSNESPVSALTP